MNGTLARLALLSACLLALRAGDAPTQPVLLPMDQLLRRLDQTQEWMFVPLADYRALVAAAARQEPDHPGLLGARIASAQLAGTLTEDRIVAVAGTLVVEVHGDGPQRCRLFATRPARLGAITCDGQPAVVVATNPPAPQDQARKRAAAAPLDLLLPGPGRHQVTLSWGVDLAGDEQRRHGVLPLPYAGAAALTIDAATAGSFTGGGLVADPAQPGRWRLAGAATLQVPLVWEPGRLGAGVAAVFGVDQVVQAELVDGPAPLRWAARLITRRGATPERLELALPAGWRLTRSASAGVLAINEQADGRVRLTLAPGTGELACDGFRAPDAPLALPQVVGAAYQGGVVMVRSAAAYELQAPLTWRRLEDADGLRRYAVPAPGDATVPLPATGRWGMDVRSSASVELTDGRRPWTMVQSIDLADHGGDLGEMRLRLPAGWSLSALEPDQALWIRELAGGGEVADLPAGATLTLVPQAVRLRALHLTLTLGRTAADGVLLPVLVDGARRASHRLSLLSTAPLDARITAGAPWRLEVGDVQALPAGALRADLLATGEVAAVQAVVSRLVPEVGAEAVLYLAPGLGGDHWCRVDLRLAVRSGEVERLRLAAPLVDDARLQVVGNAVTREPGAAPLTLAARVPLTGDHLLRIEGALAPDQLGSLARLALTVGDDTPVPVRQVVVVQAPPQADLVLAAGPGAIALAADALPAWSRPLPGVPVSAAWRLGGGESGTYRLERRDLADAPAGFIDQVAARSQIDPTGTLTLLTARVAAPAVQALPLTVPAGLALVQATIDGQQVAVRRTAGGQELPLPGRTQVQVALLFRGPAPGRDVHLPLPRLGALPATATAWTVAVAGGWRAVPLDEPAAMPLAADGATVGRPWFGAWWEAPVAHRVPGLPPVSAAPAADDPRALASAAGAPPATGEPVLVLHGHLFAGTRLGGEAVARLELTALDTLRGHDHLGRVLALLVALLLTWRMRPLPRAAVGAAALLLAAALHGWQGAGGPLLALAEWLAPALLAVGVLCALLRQRPPLRAGAPVAALLALGTLLSAGEAATEVLMGYQRLDPKGVPQEVKVALTRLQLTALWQRAQGVPPAAAPCDLATGTPRFDLRFVDGHLRGTLTLAVAVPGTAWQQVRLPVVAGAVRGVAARPLGGADPGTVAWAGDAAGAVVLTLAPRQQAEVVIELDVPLTARAGEWSVALPLPAIPGGRLTLHTPAELAPWLGERRLVAQDGAWTHDLPLGQPQVVLALRRPQAAVARELRLGIDQQVRVQLHHDRLEWSARLLCTAQGGGLRRLVVGVPEGLALTAVEGEGVADWTQRGTQAEITAAGERSGAWTLRLAGVLTSAAGAAPERGVLPTIAGAERVAGRLDLVNGAGLRFDRPAGERIERVDPQEGADQAVRWNSDPGALTVRWRALDDELAATLRAQLAIGVDRVRVHAALDLAGPGRRDALRLHIPAPWEVVGVPDGVELVWRTVAGRRECTVRAARPWAAGMVPELRLEAERRVLGADITAPDLRPLDGSVTAQRQVWLFAGAGDRRVRLEDDARQQAMGVEAARGVLGGLATLAQGERWLQACSWRGDGAPRLTLAADESVVRVAASHYLLLGQDRVRWSAHLVHQPEQGELAALRCTLPAGARLVRVQADGLGTWTLDGRELGVVLAAPTRAAVALDLELELPLTGDAVAIAAPLIPGASVAQDVALVEEDDLGLVHLEAQGLDAVGDRAVPFACPVGVDPAAIRHRWRSQRPQWSLGVRREALATTTSVDNVVTLADVVSVLGVDGECRGRGVWQVLNRTRTHLTVALPAGVELWEARVAGADVRPRRGANPGEVILPVTPQRPGEAAQAITLTWRERLDPAAVLRPGIPRFTELRIMQGLWRVVPPPGHVLTRRGGTLEVTEPVAAEACRAQNVIDELKRLRTLGDLDDAGLKRLNEQLVSLDLQLSDNLVSLQQQQELPVQSRRQQAFGAEVISSVAGNRSELQQELKRIDGVRVQRGERRSKLGIDNASQSWSKVASAPVAAGTYAARPALPLADRTPQRLAPDATLGNGQPPPGQRGEDQRALLGIDLLADPGGEGLILHGQTSDLRLELGMARTGGAIGPWLLALAALAVLGAGLWAARRP